MPSPKEVIEQGLVHVPEAVVERWEDAQLVTIWDTVAKGLSIREFEMFMTLAAKYKLDPLLHEIWAAKGEARDGKPSKLLIMVGRDGLLRNARRDANWRGFDADVVREKDVFRIKRSKDGREIIHEYEGTAKGRGEIRGAWAQVYITGRHDVYFFAPWDEYAPRNLSDSKMARSPWKTQPSVMIQKCALSLCLRLAFNLSGVVGEEEAARVFDEEPEADGGKTSLSAVAEGFPEDLRDRFYAAYGEASELRPGSLSPAVVQMSVADQPREAVEAFLDQVEAENAAARAGDEVPDAEVVDVGSADVEALRVRLSGLLDRRTDVEENPSDVAETQAALEALDAEIEHVEGLLRDAGGEVPGQEAMQI